MDYRVLFIELAALLLVYYLLHSDNMAILDACMDRKESSHANHMTEEDRVMADAIFGSIAAPLFSAKMGAQKPTHTVEEVEPKPEESPGASQTTAASAVRRRTPKKAATDVPTT